LKLPIYTFRNRCDEDLSLILDDKKIKKIFNAPAYKDEKDLEISALLQYICKQEPVDDFTNKLSSIVAKIKSQEVNRKEYQSMNLHDRDNFRRGLKEGINQGAEQAKIETAKNLFSMSLSIEQIAKATGLSIEEIQALAK
jgi:predicted transposase/invertase (TIGR01784 family)